MKGIEQEIEYLETVVRALQEEIKFRLGDGKTIENYDYAIGSGQRRFEKVPLKDLMEMRNRENAKLQEAYRVRDDEEAEVNCIVFE